MNTSSRPRDVGILGMEVYFPKQYVSQEELGNPPFSCFSSIAIFGNDFETNLNTPP